MWHALLSYRHRVPIADSLATVAIDRPLVRGPCTAEDADGPLYSVRGRSAVSGGADAPPGAGRDVRIDLLRGIAVVAMVIDHIAGPSVLYVFTGGNRFYTSAAEAFVVLSGLVMGLVYRRHVERDGLGPSLHRAIERGMALYLLTVSLTLLVVPVAALLHLEWAPGLPVDDPIRFVVSVLTLHQTSYLVDIPLLYTLLILVSPLALTLLAQGRTAAVLVGSWTLWGLHQLFPAQAAVPWTIEGNHLFSFAAWQVFFFTGLVLGWHHSALASRLAGVPRRLALVVSGVAFAALVALDAVAGRLPQIWGADPERAADLQLFLVEALFSKTDVRIGRIVASIVVFGFCYLLVTVLWRPFHGGLGWFLLPLGQHALYAYAAHVLLALPARLVTDGLPTPELLVDPRNAALQIAALAGTWLLIRARVFVVDPTRGRARYAWPMAATLLCLLVLPLVPSHSNATVALAAEPDERAVRVGRAFGTPVPSRTSYTGGRAFAMPVHDAGAALSLTVASSASAYVGALRGIFHDTEFFSPALQRMMPYFVYLPPGYEQGVSRYPVLYMLHGNSGSYEEWAAYGLIDQADALISRGEIRPLIIVLPQGDYSYWVNLEDGPAYGDYLSIDLVRHINRSYRVLPGGEHRAIGGLSMGGTGALVHAFINPSVFGTVGAHSPALPEEGWREFLGRGEQFAHRDPISLALFPLWFEELAIWIDIGDEDSWLPRAELLHATLSDCGVDHQWHVFAGDHWGEYWVEHIPDYLRFYAAALNR